MLLYCGFKEKNLLSACGLTLLSFFPINFGQRVIKRLRRTLQISILGSLGNLCEHGIHELVFARPVRPLLNDIKGNFDGTLQFRESLIKVQSLFRSEALSERHDHAALQTHRLRRLENTARFKNIDQFFRALADRQCPDMRIPNELNADSNGLGEFRCRYRFPGGDPTDISPTLNVPAT
jgi:hypothetical protein